MKDIIPQIRVRTEYSFKKAYGPLPRVVEVLNGLGCKFAAMVDSSGTWGHVKWQKQTATSGILYPGYGAEIKLSLEDGRNPTAWILAEDIKKFYNFTSSNPTTPEAFAEAKGVIRFSGNALQEPGLFDHIDINPSSVIAIKRALELHKRTRKPLVLTSANEYPAPADKNKFLAWIDNRAMTPQHLLSQAEFEKFFSFLGKSAFKKAVHNTIEVAERASGIVLPIAPIIKVKGNLRRMVNAGKKKRLEAGQIKEWSADYEARLEREMKMIKVKEYESYFITVAKLVIWGKQNMLVGPARGSSAGSLVCYLLRITEVDPLVYGLLFERFIDINRNDLPDIDVDFSDKKRPLVFEYLKKQYGADNVAKIGNVTRLKPKSVMAHVGKKLGISAGATLPVLNVLIDHAAGDARYGKSLEDTFTDTEPGRKFIGAYPEGALIAQLENHASHTSVHAGGIIVSNEPVIDYCTVLNGVAHVDKKDAEALNLLKIDALGLRTLGVIEDAGCVDAETLYSLTYDDPKVFEIFNQKKYSGLFQFEGATQRSVAATIPIHDFQTIDHITAISRPGPLGGGAFDRYRLRNEGREEITYWHESMEEYLGETKGVVLYQEQVMKIVREVGGFSWEDTSKVRKLISQSVGNEALSAYEAQFVKGAARLGIPAKRAQGIWREICSFGAYGMNKSHTTSYAMVSYWCAYMKLHFPIEYAAACLRNAKDAEQTTELLREVVAEGVRYLPFDPNLSEQDWVARDGSLIGGYENLHGIGPIKAAKYIEKRNSVGLDEKDLETLRGCAVGNEDLRPGHTLWGQFYDDPSLLNVYGKIKEFEDLKDREDSVVICQLVKKERRDENEAYLVAKRNGKRKPGQTLFIDLFVVDDSISKPIRARLHPKHWRNVGEKIAEGAVEKQDWFLIRGKNLPLFNMIAVDKIRCLTNLELLA